MPFPSFISRKPLTSAAIVIILLGGAIFLLLPIIVGTGGSYEVQSSDKITSWSWQGPYKDGGEKEKQAKEEISQLKLSLGKKGINRYDTLVGIAGNYELLGDGKAAYSYLSQAIALEPTKGLAYMNMAHLMEVLGADQTAAEAYDKAVAAEPNNPIFQSARSNFLLEHQTKP